MGRFQLELIYCFTFIFHRRPFVVNTFSTGLVGVEVTEEQERNIRWKMKVKQ